MVGEHIRTRKDGRWMHAIDCGDETVIHLVEDAPAAVRVRRSYRPAFVSGAEAVEVVTHRERTFPATEIVARAYSRIADPGLAAMFRDSEAFAEWCATGRLPPGPANVAIAPPGQSPAPAAASPPQEPPAAAVKARPARSAPAVAKRAPPAPRARKAAKRAPAARSRRAAPKRAAKKASAPARKKAARPGAKAKAKRSRR